MNLESFCAKTDTERIISEYASSVLDDISWMKTVGILEISMPSGDTMNFSTDGIHAINLYRKSKSDAEAMIRYINFFERDGKSDYISFFDEYGINVLSDDLKKINVNKIKVAPAQVISDELLNNPVDLLIYFEGLNSEEEITRQTHLNIVAERATSGVDFTHKALSIRHMSEYLFASIYCGFTPKKSDFTRTANLIELKKIYGFEEIKNADTKLQ